MDAGLVWTALGTVATCIGLLLAWRQVSAQKRPSPEVHEHATKEAVGASVAVPSPQLPANVRGRDGVLRELRRSFRRRSGATVILSGMGGVGKSTVAATFADWVGRPRGGLPRPFVWWVTAADRVGLVAAMVTVARRLGAARVDIEAIGSDLPDAPDRLWALLNRSRRKWLLIFDNADEPSVLGCARRSDPDVGQTFDSVAAGTGWLRSSGRGMVLVTSRDSNATEWGRPAQVIPLGPLNELDAAQVLLDRAPEAGDDVEAGKLARRLGGLPLALQLAGAYLGSGVALRTSFRDYRLAFDDPVSTTGLLAFPPDSQDERAVVLRTWEMSLDTLDSHGVPQARPLLRLLSCYAWTNPVPLWLLAPERLASLFGSADTGVELRLMQGLARLNGLRLINVVTAANSRGRAVILHPVVADTNRSHLRHDEVHRQLVCHTAVGLVASVLEYRHHERATDWPTYLTLGPHVRALLETVAQHVDRRHLEDLVSATTATSRAHNLCGAVPESERLMRTALAALAPLEDDDPLRLAVLQDLAWPIASQGRSAEAEAIYRDVFAARCGSLGEEHPETVRTRHELAWVAAVQGRFAEAEAAYRDVLEVRRRIVGAEHPDTLLTQHELGWVIALQSRASEAEPILLQVLEIRRRVLGEAHLRTVKTRHELAWITAVQGRWAEAEAQYRDLLDRGQHVLGKEHPDMLTFRHELAWVLSEQDGRPAASQEYRDVLELRRRILGDDHPDTIATRHALDRLLAGHTTPARHLA